MTKYTDLAFGSALVRPADQDLAGRNLANAHAKLHQLPLDPDRFASPTEFRVPVAPVETDADRMDFLRAYGWKEAVLCKLSKTPGALERLCSDIRRNLAQATGVSKSVSPAAPSPTPENRGMAAALLASADRMPDGFFILAEGTREPSKPVMPAMEHSVLLLHDTREDGPVPLEKNTAEEAYRFLVQQATHGSAAIAKANAKRLSDRYRS
jgi:hypothetical protein